MVKILCFKNEKWSAVYRIHGKKGNFLLCPYVHLLKFLHSPIHAQTIINFYKNIYFNILNNFFSDFNFYLQYLGVSQQHDRKFTKKIPFLNLLSKKCEKNAFRFLLATREAITDLNLF